MQHFNGTISTTEARKRNSFTNDGNFMAQFLQNQAKKQHLKAENKSEGINGSINEDVKRKNELLSNDGSFMNKFLALQKEKKKKTIQASNECLSSPCKQTNKIDVNNNILPPKQAKNRKRSRWDSNTPSITKVKNNTTLKKVSESKEGYSIDYELYSIENEKNSSSHAKELKDAAELQFLENRLRAANEQSTITMAKEKSIIMQQLLDQERLKEYERLAAQKHKEDGYIDTVEDAELGCVINGTFEHRKRAREMLNTIKISCDLTVQAEGKHHLGDFLPQTELNRLLQERQVSNGVSRLNNSSSANEILPRNANQGSQDSQANNDDEFDQYRKRMMLAYRFRPNPLNNPRRKYY